MVAGTFGLNSNYPLRGNEHGSARATPESAFERNQVLDRAAVAELIQRERAARDGARWEEMATYHHPESMIDVAWF